MCSTWCDACVRFAACDELIIHPVYARTFHTRYATASSKSINSDANTSATDDVGSTFCGVAGVNPPPNPGNEDYETLTLACDATGATVVNVTFAQWGVIAGRCVCVCVCVCE
jgi:hypothetical protein